MARSDVKSASIRKQSLIFRLLHGGWRQLRSSRPLRLVCLVLALAVVYQSAIHLILMHAKSLIRGHQVELANEWLSCVHSCSFDRVETRILLAQVSWHEGKADDTRKHLMAAKSLGCSSQRIQFEQTLILAYEGRLDGIEHQLPDMLSTSDGDLQRVCDAFVTGYLRQFRFADARGLINVWRQDFPDDSQPWFHEGCIYQFEMRTDQAATAFEKALAIAPKRLDIRERLAAVHVLNLEFASAAEHYSEMLRIRPNDVEWLVGHGVCRFNSGETELARQSLAKALTISPAHREGRLALAELHANDGKFDEALRLSSELYQEFPQDYSVRYLMVRMLRAVGREGESRSHVQWLEDAERSSREVSKLTDEVSRQPDDVRSRFEIAKHLVRYEKYSEAVGWLRAAHHLDPHNDEVLNLLVESCRHAGFKDLAASYSSP